jgi:biopolymer transport protein ExbD
MGRFRRAAAADAGETGIDISPLMDCVFILLIFFIVTTTFVEETGIEVDKPQAGGPSLSEKTTIVIALTENGHVLHKGREIGLGGVRPLVERALREEEVPVVIQADAAATSGLLMRVVDEAKLAGSPRVSVATRRKEG